MIGKMQLLAYNLCGKEFLLSIIPIHSIFSEKAYPANFIYQDNLSIFV
jgi:hypothetical protein